MKQKKENDVILYWICYLHPGSHADITGGCVYDVMKLSPESPALCSEFLRKIYLSNKQKTQIIVKILVDVLKIQTADNGFLTYNSSSDFPIAWRSVWVLVKRSLEKV